MTGMCTRIRIPLAGLALAALVGGGAMAATATIEVSLGPVTETYEFTTFVGAPIANQTLLEAQPWWGNGEIATAFSVALGTTFGTPNLPDSGPYFAFGFDEGDINNGTRVIASPSSFPFVADSFQADRTYVSRPG